MRTGLVHHFPDIRGNLREFSGDGDVGKPSPYPDRDLDGKDDRGEAAAPGGRRAVGTLCATGDYLSGQGLGDVHIPTLKPITRGN
jgi:hypothetical protein